MKHPRPSFNLLVATLCLAAQALVVGHYALVKHTRCAEHGELIHADAHGTGHGTQHQAVDESHVASDLITTGEAAHDEGHEHCATTSERRKAVFAPAPTVVMVAVRIAPSSVSPRQVLGVSRAVHWIAPKTSPPV